MICQAKKDCVTGEKLARSTRDHRVEPALERHNMNSRIECEVLKLV